MSLYLSFNQSQFVLSSFLLGDDNKDNSNNSSLRILLLVLLLSLILFMLLLDQRLFFNLLRRGQLSRDKATACVANARQGEGRRGDWWVIDACGRHD